MSDEFTEIVLKKPEETSSGKRSIYTKPEKVSIELEKVIFNWLIENPLLTDEVPGDYFNNEDIRLVYNAIKKWVQDTNAIERPNNNTILQIVRDIDPHSEKISNHVLKKMVTIDWSQYELNRIDGKKPWIKQKLEAWLVRNRIWTGISDVVMDLRSMPDTDYDKVMDMAYSIQNKVQKFTTSIDDDDNVTLLDIKNPEHHIQPTALEKITTGYNNLDLVLGGGWDFKTLNILMAPSGSGKSVWMCNLAVNAIKKGYNVLYVTLELSDKKVIKRMGSNLYDIPISEYDVVSRDVSRIERLIESSHKLFSDGIREQGQLLVQEFPAGTLTCSRLETFIQKLQRKRNVKFHLVIVDYLNLMCAESGMKFDNSNLYMKGKHIAEGLRRIAQIYKLAMITPTQVTRDAINAQRMTLEDLPESKAIGDTADVVVSSIKVKNENGSSRYLVDPIKLRDADFGDERLIFDFDKEHLRVQNIKIINK